MTLDGFQTDMPSRYPPASPYWTALSAESLLASDQLSAGASNLSRIDPTLVGSFYAAMFPLSIGYERLAKIIVQIDARLTTGEFLTTKQMKDVGHEIGSLFNQIEVVAERRGYLGENYLRPTDAITNAITEILDDFATGGRYNHLDSLGNPSMKSASAEKQWDEQVMLPIAGLHLTARTEQRIAFEAAALDSAFSATRDLGAIAFHHDVNGASHTGVASVYMRRALYERLIPWARMYALRSGRWLAYIVDSLSTEALSSENTRDHVPYLIEFFAWLQSPDAYMRQVKHPGK